MAWTVRPSSCGHLGHGQPVEVAQRERGLVVRAELGQHLARPGGVDVGVPRVLPRDDGLLDGLQLALLPGPAPPVVDQLVAGHPDQPGHRQVGHGVALDGGDGGEEGLGRQVLGDGGRAGARQQVAVDLGEGTVVEREEAGALVGDGRLTTHACIIVGGRPVPTGRVRTVCARSGRAIGSGRDRRRPHRQLLRLLRGSGRRRTGDGGGRPDRLPDRRLAGRAHDAHPLPRAGQAGRGRLRPHLRDPDGAGHGHLPRSRHQGGGQRRRARPGRLRGGGAGGGGPAGAGPSHRGRHRRRPPGPARRARRRRSSPRPPRHRRTPGRPPRHRGDRQRLPRLLGHRRGARRRRGHRDHRPGDRRRDRDGAGGARPRLGPHRLGPPGRRLRGRARHRVRGAGHRRQLRVLHRDPRPAPRRLPDRRDRGRRLVRHHEAPGHRRAGRRGHGHLAAALRDRQRALPEPRRRGPLRHHLAQRRRAGSCAHRHRPG